MWKEFFQLEEGLLTTKTLDSLSVAINTVLRTYICMPCGCVQTEESIWQHLTWQHDMQLSSNFKVHLKEVPQRAKIVNQFPEMVATIKPALRNKSIIALYSVVVPQGRTVAVSRSNRRGSSACAGSSSACSPAGPWRRCRCSALGTHQAPSLPLTHR